MMLSLPDTLGVCLFGSEDGFLIHGFSPIWVCLIVKVLVNPNKIPSNHADWSNAPTITILPTTTGTYHGLNCFSHMIYMPQTSMYKNIAKSLTPLSNLKQICVEILHKIFFFPTLVYIWNYSVKIIKWIKYIK